MLDVTISVHSFAGFLAKPNSSTNLRMTLPNSPQIISPEFNSMVWHPAQTFAPLVGIQSTAQSFERNRLVPQPSP